VAQCFHGGYVLTKKRGRFQHTGAAKRPPAFCVAFIIYFKNKPGVSLCPGVSVVKTETLLIMRIYEHKLVYLIRRKFPDI